MIDEAFDRRLAALMDIFHRGGGRNHAIRVFACVGGAAELAGAIRSTPAAGALLLLCETPPPETHISPGQAPTLVIEWPGGGNAAAAAKLSLALGALKAVKVIKGASPGILAARGCEWGELERTIDDMLMGVRHERLSRLPRTRCCIQNLCRLSRNSRAAAKLADPRTPALVCGAGPSAAAQFEILRRFAGRVVVIAVGRMAERLAAADIIPDFCVMVDPEAHDDSARVLPTAAALVCPASLSPVVVDKFTTRLWRGGDDPFFRRWLERINFPLEPIAISGTAMVSAIDFALSLCPSSVAVIGSDLCLGEGGAKHVPGYYPARSGDDRAAADELTEAVGNVGGMVPSTAEFDRLRGEIETYIAKLPPDQAAALVNATNGGARIVGMTAGDLTETLAAAPEPGQKFSLVSAAEPAPELDIGGMAADFQTYRGVLEDWRSNADKILNLLADKTSERQRIERNLRLLDMISDRERSLAESSRAFPIIAALTEQVDELLIESPPAPAATADAAAAEIAARVVVDRRRANFAAALAADFAADLEYAAAVAAGGEIPERPSTVVCRGFRALAVDLVAASHPEFAAALEQRRIDSTAGYNFEFCPYKTAAPEVAAVDAAGNCRQLTPGRSEMEKHAVAAADKLIEANHLANGGVGLVFTAPVNWLVAASLRRRLPDLPLLVIEPWPELMDQIIDHHLFAHQFDPGNTHVLAATPQFPEWRGIRGRILDEWRNAGIKPITADNPQTSEAETIKHCSPQKT